MAHGISENRRVSIFTTATEFARSRFRGKKGERDYAERTVFVDSQKTNTSIYGRSTAYRCDTPVEITPTGMQTQ